MKILISVSAAVILWTNTVTAAPPRSAEDILKEFDTATRAMRPVLAWELYQSHPTHGRAVELLLVRWADMQFDRPTLAMKEIEAFVKEHPDSPRIADVFYTAADVAMRNHHPDTVKGKAYIEDFIRKLPQDERGSELLETLAYYSRANAQRAIYRRIAADYAGTHHAKLAEGALRRMDGIGKSIDLSFDEVVTGKPISLKDMRGKVVVLHFWSTTCGACLAEFSAMQVIYARNKDDGVEFIGVNLDHPSHGVDVVKKCIADHKITWPQYYQGKGQESEFSQSWGVNAMPTLFIVDRDGNLFSTEARQHLESIISKALSKPVRKE